MSSNPHFYDDAESITNNLYRSIPLSKDFFFFFFTRPCHSRNNWPLESCIRLALSGNKVTVFTMAARRLFNALQGQTDLYYDVSIVFGTCARTSKHSKYVQSCVMSAEKNAFPRSTRERDGFCQRYCQKLRFEEAGRFPSATSARSSQKLHKSR